MYRNIGDKYGIATTDVTTGDFFVTEVDSERKLLDELNRFSPTEIICNEPFYMSGVDIDDMKERMGMRYPLWIPGISGMIWQRKRCCPIFMYRIWKGWD